MMWPENAIYIPWDVWIASWITAALWANRTVKRAGLGREWRYQLLEFGGFVMLLFFAGQTSADFAKNAGDGSLLARRYWALSPTEGWAMVAAATAGFSFCWWARLHLGRLWSGWVTKKEDHRIIETGPYAIVRHPIYTGVLVAALATAAEKATGFALVGFAMLVAGYVLKARVEERFLRRELDADAYDSYRRRVPMLLPFGPKAV
jgi:protein-S-isoprenylcysteine O-methyltransferase Ste14